MVGSIGNSSKVVVVVMVTTVTVLLVVVVTAAAGGHRVGCEFVICTSYVCARTYVYCTTTGSYTYAAYFSVRAVFVVAGSVRNGA